MKKKVFVVGANGKMGTAVCEILEGDYEIVEGLKGENWANFSADLIIDFGSAESSLLSAKWASKNGVPLIVGSTGQTEKELFEIRKICKDIPFMICRNFSIGVALMKSCISQILKLKIDDVCVFEKHHRAKKDTPSGTAISLAKFISERYDLPVQMLSERGGEEIGTHKIDFYFGSELVEIKHSAFSRKAFAWGVKQSVDFMFKNDSVSEICFEDVLKKKFNIFCE